jgi:hypothetical protein
MGAGQVFAVQAASGTAANQPGGLFMLALGVAASLGGLMLVTNFRGFADAAAELRNSRWSLFGSRDSDASFRRNKVLVRIVGAVFAVVGPIMTVAGIVTSIHGHFSVPDTAAAPVPFRYLFVAGGAFVIAFYWTPHRRGFALTAARQGRWRCAAAIVASLGAAVFVIGVAYGRMTIGIAAWLASGLLAIALFIFQPRTRDPS